MIAIITGGTKGIGYAVTESLLEKGYTCFAASRRTSAEMEALQKTYPAKLFFVAADISSAEARAALLKEVLRLGVPDLLVNCAGVAPKVRKDMLEITEEDYDYVMDINAKGTFFMSQAVANAMLPAGKGRIVNISSVSSYTASVKRAEYCISKASISMMTKLFAARLGAAGIGVFEVSPGIIDTEMTSVVKDSYLASIQSGLTPIPRMGMPRDVAGCVSAIASGDLDFCTGTVLHADGGFQIRRL